MATQSLPQFTLEEYLKLEREAETKSEYIQGTIVAMAEPTRNHNRIKDATLSWLHQQLRGKDCEAAGSDTRLYIAAYNVGTYPDVAVICGPNNFLDERKDTITDATVIVEVLSPTTQNYDIGAKFRFYQGLPSFSEYVILAQDSIRGEHHTRQQDGSWVFRRIEDPTAVIELTSIGCRLPLAALYERVEF
jgi:Uma2 family endonuclease